MSGNPQAIRDRLGEAGASTYSADVVSLNALVDRLSRSPAATAVDRALLGRIRASARLLDQPKRIKERARKRFREPQMTEGHLGRGCPDD